MSNEQQSPPKYEFASGEFEWVEKAAIENLKGRRETADVLAKEAVTTLTVLLAGAGGSWALAIKLLDEIATNGTVAAFVAALWLTVISMLVVFLCLKIKPIPALYNQPGKLLERHEHGFTFDQWRLAELKNIDARIATAVKRNNSVASRLNVLRVAATLTPILAVLGVLVFRCYLR